MLNDLRDRVDAILASIRSTIDATLPRLAAVRDAAATRAMELEVAAVARTMADAIVGAVLTEVAADSALQIEASVAARFGSSELRSGGRRSVEVNLVGGGAVKLTVEYLQPNRRNAKSGRKDRNAAKGKSGSAQRRTSRGRGRGKGGSGVYPVLAALGIWFGVTPALAGEVCRQVVDSDSVRAGRSALERRGIVLSQGKTLRLVNHFSHRAVEQRSQWMAMARASVVTGNLLRGKRVVVATDGGRLRERVPAKNGRRRANGHRRYDAPWIEPKLLVIYLVDDKGRITDDFRPVYDGTLENCDAIFAMIEAYLIALGTQTARALIVVSDGAKWIWERTAKLAVSIGLAPEKLIEVVDNCHAIATLHDIADVSQDLREQDRARWLKQAKRLLEMGFTSQLTAHIRTLASAVAKDRAKDILSHLDYFARNERRMQYRWFRSMYIPIGSGAVESAVRRIINMRLKSNAMFWLEINAEGMLMLRSYLKADRFDDLVDWSLRAAAAWWHPEWLSPLGPVASSGQSASNGNAHAPLAADVKVA